MDQSFGSPLNVSGRSPFTPRMSRTAKTPLVQSSLKKSSRFSVSGRSIQLPQTLLKSQSYSVERFGSTLPVIITEALTFSERNSLVSVRISECGYCWLVSGRRLLVWQYRHSSQGHQHPGTPQRKNTGATQCYELMLPQSDLAHRADLVCVFSVSGSHVPACIAVSPEGVVRYWPNVSHEGLSVEVAAELQGQECDSVSCLGRLGCVLATTTCTVVLVQPRLSAGGRHSLACHTLRTPQGWLGAIGKKMSSLIFGPMATDHSTETRLVRVLSVKQTEEQWWVFVLAGHMLQKWHMNFGEPEQLVYVTELGRVIRDAFQCTAWESCGSDPTDIDLWLLDIQVVGNSIMLLASAVNLHVSPQVQYAIVRLDASIVQTTAQIEEFLLLKLYGLYQEDNTAEFLSYRLLLCENDIYIHRTRDITIVQSSNEPEILDFNSIGDKILGGSVCLNTPVFFTQNHGLVAVYASDITQQDLSKSCIDMPDVTINESFKNTSLMGHLTLYNLEPEDVMTAHKNTLCQFKAAFLFFIKNNQSAYQEILSELFPEEGEVKNEVDNVLDKIVVQVSQELLNDAPAGDPRWIEDDKPIIGLGSSNAMQIPHQLQDKQNAHNLYLQFIQSSGLWSRLSALTHHNTTVSTLHILADHIELTVAAICLHNLLNSHGSLLGEVIENLYQDSDCKGGLNKQDLFFKEISKVDRIVNGLASKCEKMAKSGENPIEIVNLIIEANNIIMIVLNTVMELRQQKASMFTSTASTKIHLKYVPWTFCPGKHRVYESLYRQQDITLNHGARVSTEGSSRACLYDQYVSLVDLILDARKCNVESMRNTPSFDSLNRQYQNERQKLIQPLVADKEWERAALLAEKYLDYTTLIVICENTNNQQRLDEYLERFKSDDFAQHVFNWYLQENKQGKLLARCKASARPSSKSNLTKYLGTHPSLSWLQHMFERNYDRVAFTLNCLANDEKNLLTKKKSMLSIAKLANFVANGTDTQNEFVGKVNKELELIMYQEDLPDTILTAFGYDTIKPPVLEPEQLAQLYICGEHIDATEYDYLKALEISTFTSSEEARLELGLSIWVSAILRDNWKKQEHLSPLEVLKQKLFFKVADLAITIGARLEEVLPPVDVLLTSSLLGDLQEDKNFQYLIKLGYDHFYRSQQLDDVNM